ncbi:MAG: exopolysaccharide biosynthesis polyprenyl glycosylphosphotransferase [Candidatus Omnitrophota bacterium]|jgi:exopolysaccharide biosynthesis polyprenyl glycosylphosphotransferase
MVREFSRRSVFLLICDAAAVIASFTLAHYLRAGSWEWVFVRVPHANFVLIMFMMLFYIVDLYFPFKYFYPAQTMVDICVGVSSGMLIAFSISFLNRSFAMQRVSFFYAAIFLIVLIWVIRMIYDLLFRSRLMSKKVLILGTSLMASELIKCIRQTPHTCMNIAGILTEQEDAKRSKYDVTVVGKVADAVSLIRKLGVQTAIWACEDLDPDLEDQLTEELLRAKVMVIHATYLYEKITGEVPHRRLGTAQLISMVVQVKARSYLKVKRLVDIVAATVLLAVLMPVFLFAVIYLGIREGFPKVFFFQDRIGKDGVPFRLIKLRTMTEVRRGRQVVTEVGKWLRRYRIDEIPQLFNVLKGDMSLIGPRPEIPYFVERCRRKIPLFDLVFTVKPGITGWAQVKFRYTKSVKDYERKFRFNLYYIKNISLTIDLLILLKTVRVVLLGKGE